MFFKIGALKNAANFTGKQLDSLFNKVAGLQTCNFIKKRLQRSCFPVKFAKFLRTLFFYRRPPVAASSTSEVKINPSRANAPMQTQIGGNIETKYIK